MFRQEENLSAHGDLRYIKGWVIYFVVKKKGGGQSWNPFIQCGENLAAGYIST